MCEIHRTYRLYLSVSRFCYPSSDSILFYLGHGSLDREGYLSYNYRMNKQAISVTLDPNNVLWLRAQAASSGCRSVSEMLDRLIHTARLREKEKGEPVRSVVGTIGIAEADPDLSTADAAIRALFSASLTRQPPSPQNKVYSKRKRRHAVPGGRKGD